MTPRLILVLILLLPSVFTAGQNASKTFSKSFNATAKKSVTFDLPGTVELKTWDNATIRIEITVSLASGNAALLNELANVGRYNLISTGTSTSLVISAPNLQKQVRLKGEALKEQVNYLVFVPKNIAVEMPVASTAAVQKQ